MRVLGEDLVQYRTHVLPIAVLVEMQLDDVLEGQRLAADRMPLELHDIWHDVGDVVGGPIRSACLHTGGFFNTL